MMIDLLNSFNYEHLMWKLLICSLFGPIIIFAFRKICIKRLPPGPMGYPIIGNLSLKNSLQFFDHKRKYGHVSHIKVLGKNIVILNSIESIRYALQRPGNSNIFDYRPQSYFQNNFTYPGIIFDSPDYEWKRAKNLMHNLIKQHGKGIEALEKVVAGELNSTVRIVGQKVPDKIDIYDILQHFTTNIIITLLEGERYDYGDVYIKDIQALFNLADKTRNPVNDLILTACPFLIHFNFGIGKIIKDLVSLREKLLLKFYYDKKSLPVEERLKRNGIIYDLIELKNNQSWLSEERILGSIIGIYGAGSVTTSVSLYSFFLILLNYPRIQEKIQSEIDKVIGLDRKPCLSDQQNMPFTRAAILELFRYSSILPVSVPHRCAETTTFYGFTIPRDSVVLPNLFLVHHDEDLWDNPWDFKPERFLDECGELLPASDPIRRNLIPFGIGKRSCLGEIFAKSRIFLFITFMLQRFTFSFISDPPPSCDPRHYVCNLLLCPKRYELKVNNRNIMS